MSFLPLLRYLPLVFVIFFAGTTYYLYKENRDNQVKLLLAQGELTRTQLARAKSNEQATKLKDKLDEATEKEVVEVVRLVEVPVDKDSETCVSPVLKEAIK